MYIQWPNFAQIHGLSHVYEKLNQNKHRIVSSMELMTFSRLQGNCNKAFTVILSASNFTPRGSYMSRFIVAALQQY